MTAARVGAAPRRTRRACALTACWRCAASDPFPPPPKVHPNTGPARAGADDLRGRAGDDTFSVDDAGDAVVEEAGQGTDTVQTTISLGLPANVEVLQGTGSAALNLTGSAGAPCGGVRALPIETGRAFTALVLTKTLAAAPRPWLRHDTVSCFSPTINAQGPTRSLPTARATRWPAAPATTPLSAARGRIFSTAARVGAAPRRARALPRALAMRGQRPSPTPGKAHFTLAPHAQARIP